MSYNIKGITVKINGDASNLQREINKIKAETSGLDKQMSTLKKSMKGLDGKDFKSMAQYQQLVSTKMQSLTKQANQYQKTLDAMPKSYGAWNKQISTLTARNKELETNIKNGTGSIIGQTQELKSNQAVLKSLGTDWDAYDQKLQATRTSLLTTQNNLKALGNEFLTTNSNVLQAVTSLDNASVALDKFSNSTKYISLGSAAAIAGATMAAISFEDAWTGVLKTTEGTPAQLEAINNGIKELATSTSSSYESIAHYAELAGQLGVATDAIVGFTETVTMLGDTTNLVGDAAAQQIAKFANIMIGTEGQTNEYFSRLGSSVVDLGNNFATTEADIMNMSMRLATAGRQVGFTSQDVLGLATALSSVGIEAAAGGGSMSKMLKNVEYAVATNSEALQAFADVSGMSAEQFIQLWGEDAPTAFGKLLEGIGKSENITKTLDDLGITEVRMSNAMGALAQNTDLYWNAISKANSAFEQNHAMAAEAEKRYGTLKSTLVQTWEAIKQAADELGQSFAPKLEAVANVIKDVVEWFTNLDDSAKDMIANLLLVGAALSPTSKALSKLSKGGSGLIQFFTKGRVSIADFAKSAGLLSKESDVASMSITGLAKSAAKSGAPMATLSKGASSLLASIGPLAVGLGGTSVALGAVSVALYTAISRSEQAKDAFDEQLASEDAMYATTLKLIEGMDEYNQSIQNHLDTADDYLSSFKEQSKEADMLVDRIGQLTSQEQLNGIQKELLLESIDKLNQIYPELGLYYDENSGKLRDNTGNIYDNNDALKKRISTLQEEAKAEAYANAIKETTQALIEQQLQYEQTSASIEDTRKKMKELWDQSNNGENLDFSQWDALQEKIQELMPEYEGMLEKIKETQTELMNSANKFETGGLEVIGESLKNTFQTTADSFTQLGIQIPQNIKDGIMAGSYSYREASQFTASMLTFQEAMNNGMWAGQAIPTNLVNGLIAGAPSIQAATMYIDNLMKFSNALVNAGYTGGQIPQEIAQAVASGQMSVSDATNVMMSGSDEKIQEAITKLKQDASKGSKETGDAMGDGKSNAATAAGGLGKSGRDAFTPYMSDMKKSASDMKSSVMADIDTATKYAKEHPIVVERKTVNTEESGERSASAVLKMASFNPFNSFNMRDDMFIPSIQDPSTYQSVLSQAMQRTRIISNESGIISQLSSKLDSFISAFKNAQFVVTMNPIELDGDVLTDKVTQIMTIREMLDNFGKGGG